MIKTIILDFDGTIGNTSNLIVRTMQQTLKQVGLPQQTDERCASTIGLPLKQCFTHLIPIDETTATICETTYRKLFAINNANYTIQVFPHVIDTIKLLNDKGIAITIASSRSHNSLMAFINDMGLKNLIKYFVGANDVKHAKPAPDMVHKIMREIGCNNKETIVVGDTHYDINMGRPSHNMRCHIWEW